MYTVEMYARIRRAHHVEGLSIREIARRYGIHRQTIRKMLDHPAPPGYRQRRPRPRPKLQRFVPIIDQILETDRDRPRKQRHTALRIFDRLREEYGYEGGYTTVKDYVREQRHRTREVFVPLVHAPGTSQGDFGEALARIAGQLTKVHFFVLDLPQSDAAFIKAYPAETTEALLDAVVSAVEFFGGVPRSLLLDNMKLAVAKIHGDGRRDLTARFTELMSHYLFEPRFGRPGKGNDKGDVEGLVGWFRRNYLVPVPDVPSFTELNARLEQACLDRLDRRLRGHKETIGERLERELAAMLPIPPGKFEACDGRPGQVSSPSLVRYKTNDYSVPTRYAHRKILIRGYVDEVVIACESEEIARHQRSYGREEFIFNPLHYLALIEQKINAFDQAAPLAGWELPAEFDEVQRHLEARAGTAGRREYVQVLRLLEDFEIVEVRNAIRQAIRIGAMSVDAIRLLIIHRLEKRPPRLDLRLYPYLPKAEVATTRPVAYMELLGDPA
jgi:transposase